MVRRRRIAAGVAAFIFLLGGAVTYFALSGSSAPSHSVLPTTTTAPPVIPAVEAGILPWQIDSPLSREVALPGPGSTVTVLGGLASSQKSVPRIFSLDTATGKTTSIGNLASGVHDAAAAQIAGADFVFGGGNPDTIADVERVPAPLGEQNPAPSTTASSGGAAGAPGGAAAADGVIAGELPQPRSDPFAVTIGPTAYIVGGYTGTVADPEVLSTTDGVHFADVASLPVPVRYPAVAALGTTLYVFGGQAVGGPSDGQPVSTIQTVDTVAKKARAFGNLPEPLAGASAAVIGGNIYIAGGVTTAPVSQSVATTAPPTTQSHARNAQTTTSNARSAGATEATAGTAPGTTTPQTTVTDVWAYDPASQTTLNAGTLPAAVSHAGTVVSGGRAWLIGGEDGSGNPVASVEMFIPNTSFGTAGAPGAGSPFFGAKLLVADRGNDRILLVNPQNQIEWSYPSVYAAAPPGGFYFPDDAFFAHQGSEIISNQENNNTIVIIGFPSGQILWQYGHPKQSGTEPGYLNNPDDAYVLKNGQITVSDAYNCRVLFINPDKTVAGQIGTNGVCKHDPPADLGSPNGDTPLADGNVLISEVNGSWVSEYTPQGQLAWTVQLPIGYPSDPQQLGPDLYLISDYSRPGGIVEFTREGQVVYRYQPHSGPGKLDHPSLTELLPSGVFMVNDDYRDRMVAFDPTTQALVWQYGVTDKSGTAPGMLNTPDGFDLLMPDGSTPTHTATG